VCADSWRSRRSASWIVGSPGTMQGLPSILLIPERLLSQQLKSKKEGYTILFFPIGIDSSVVAPEFAHLERLEETQPQF
jgi:hypothetical protein